MAVHSRKIEEINSLAQGRLLVVAELMYLLIDPSNHQFIHLLIQPSHWCVCHVFHSFIHPSIFPSVIINAFQKFDINITRAEMYFIFSTWKILMMRQTGKLQFVLKYNNSIVILLTYSTPCTFSQRWTGVCTTWNIMCFIFIFTINHWK